MIDGSQTCNSINVMAYIYCNYNNPLLILTHIVITSKQGC